MEPKLTCLLCSVVLFEIGGKYHNLNFLSDTAQVACLVRIYN